jgi:hypothetical protein
VAEVHHQCATGFIQKHLPYDENDSAKSHRFFSSQFWQEKIWEKYPAEECLLGGEILKSDEDGLVATGVPAFVANSIEIRKLNERVTSELQKVNDKLDDMKSEISELKETVKTDK